MSPGGARVTPSQEARRTELPPPRRLRTGLEAWLDGWRGRWRARPAVRGDWERMAKAAGIVMAESRDLADAELADRLAAVRSDWRRRAGASVPLSAAVGLAAEMARRQTGLAAHPVQLAGAVGLWREALVEMATGEGKTLTLALAAMLRGWQGRPVHVVTANDYLARRDAQGLQRFFESGGLSVSWVEAGQTVDERRAAYAADICYTTAKELLADVLRDRLAWGPWVEAGRRAVRRMRGLNGDNERSRTVMRGVWAVLVDEADQALIDEAVTPLIISQPRPNEELRAACAEVVTWARGIGDQEFTVEAAAEEIDLSRALRRKMRADWQPRAAALQNLRWREELVRQALRARVFFRRDEHYLLRAGKVVIIDEGTGRPQEQRSWRAGLHQMIEALEGVAVTDPADTLASISFQRFFRQVPVLAGVSGTAAEAAAEFWRVYRLPVVALPPHQPCVRTRRPLRVTATAEARWQAVVAEVQALQAAGRPVLVGTRSVEASEHLARRLAAAGVRCAVLNARQLESEAEIVTRAGVAGAVTIATNMAGRGTDIRLGAGVAEAGGLVVIATELHGAARVDRQLHGRAGRQGDPGEVRCWASVEDDLARRGWPGWMRHVIAGGLRMGMPGFEGGAELALRWAQRRRESRQAQQRRALAARDERMALFLGGEG